MNSERIVKCTAKYNFTIAVNIPNLIIHVVKCIHCTLYIDDETLLFSVSFINALMT